MRKNREAPIEISKEDFRRIGYQLIDTVANFIDTIEKKSVTTGETPKQLQAILGDSSLPENGTSAEEILSKTSDLLLNRSLLTGHPKFLGYITSSPAPLGALADLLAATVNPNVGAQILSPVATEIEKQTVKWLAEFIGVSSDYGGLLVSVGNIANFTAFLAARTAKAPTSLKDGLLNVSQKLLIYCSKTTHTWIEKAAILFGHGFKVIRWIPKGHSELEAVTQNLSITTLRYIPIDVAQNEKDKKGYLKSLNEALLNELQHGGEVFLSNAIVAGNYCLRGCIVNFRTSKKDIEEIIEIIVRKGRKIHEKLQQKQTI